MQTHTLGLYHVYDTCCTQKSCTKTSSSNLMLSHSPDPFPARCPSRGWLPVAGPASHSSSRSGPDQWAPADPLPTAALSWPADSDSSSGHRGPPQPSSCDGKCLPWLWCTGTESETGHAPGHWGTESESEEAWVNSSQWHLFCHLCIDIISLHILENEISLYCSISYTSVYFQIFWLTVYCWTHTVPQ